MLRTQSLVLVSIVLLVKRSLYNGAATQAHLPSMAPSSGVVGYWYMLDVLFIVKSLLAGIKFSTRSHSSEMRHRLTDLRDMVQVSVEPT